MFDLPEAASGFVCLGTTRFGANATRFLVSLVLSAVGKLEALLFSLSCVYVLLDGNVAAATDRRKTRQLAVREPYLERDRFTTAS